MQNKKPLCYPLFTHRTDDSETEKKVKYKIELVKKTVDLLQKITRHTYKITKVIYKCGVIQKVIITFVSLVFSLGLRFGSSSSSRARNSSPNPNRKATATFTLDFIIAKKLIALLLYTPKVDL